MIWRNLQASRADSWTTCLGMALFALCAGYAINLDNGYYSPRALLWLTISIGFCLLGIALPRLRPVELAGSRLLAIVLAAGTLLEGGLLLSKGKPVPTTAVVILAFLGPLLLVPLGRLRWLLLALAVAAFVYGGVFAINLYDPQIDVLDWQQQTSEALLEGHNPYEIRFAPRYPIPRLYAPGSLDKEGRLNVAPPYPPLSLLMVVPAFAAAGDIRYAQVFAIAVSAILMALARPGLISMLATTLFLLIPRVFYVIWSAWTDPLALLCFSLLMFCACRWRKAMPWVLGLFLSSKQTSILAVPLLLLLLDGPDLWRQLRDLLIKAGIVVAAINLPFLLWNARELVRAVVLFRALPSFRPNALTYLVWIYSMTQKIPPTWLGLPVGIAAIALVLRKAPRTPAAFAAGAALVATLFFAFSKQAFCNYYYFTIATACWSIAVAQPPRPETSGQVAEAGAGPMR